MTLKIFQFIQRCRLKCVPRQQHNLKLELKQEGYINVYISTRHISQRLLNVQ